MPSNDVMEQSEHLRSVAANRHGDIKYVCSQMNSEEIIIFNTSMDMLKQKYRVVTFTDLIRIYTYHLKKDTGLMFEKVYVDEIQDCSKSQIAFLTELSFHTNYFCAIGDGKQAIYGSMNAVNDGSWSFNDTVRAFSSAMNDLTILQLRDNYRSAKNIVRFAEDIYRCTGNDVLEQNVINNQDDGNMECIRVQCGDHVAKFQKATTEFVVDKIEELHSRGVDYKDILVTSPQVNMHGKEGENITMIARALNAKNIPFYKSSATISPDDVYEYCVTFLILMKYGMVYNNRLYIERLLLDKCKDGTKREKIVNAVLDKRKVSAFGDDVVLTGIYSKFISIISDCYEKDNFDIRKAMQSARRWCEYIKKDYMKDITDDMVSKIDDAYKAHNGVLDWDDFTSALENITSQRNGVCVSSIHKTKGLEWKYVIVINAIDTSSKGVKAPGFFWKNSEEATNLMYVAVTRAMNGCYIVTTENSNSSIPVLNALRVASVINKTHEEASYC